MYRREKQAAAVFIKKFKFGVLPPEIYKYILKKYSIDKLSSGLRGSLNKFLFESAYSRKNITKSGEWGLYAQGLLQPKKGAKSPFLRGRARTAIRGLLSNLLHNTTNILAKNDVANSARIFFEIDEVFEEKMLKRKHVAKGCGFKVLKLLDSSKKPLNLDEIMRHLGYARQKKDWYQRSVIKRLKSLRFIKEKEGKIQLTEEAKNAFVLMEKQRKYMRAFKYRIKFFYPYEK